MNDPVFIDIEASAMDGFPVQVAYGSSPDNIRCFLIRPLPEWLDQTDKWSDDAFECHGFTPDFLLSHGLPAEQVMATMDVDLHGKTLFTDAPGYDRHWYQDLATGVSALNGQQFVIPEFKSINFDLLPGLSWQWMARREGIQHQLELEGKRIHHADVDVLVHILCWRALGANSDWGASE